MGYRFREKMMRFMQGRYGVDQLNRFLLRLAVVCMLLEMFIRIRAMSAMVLLLLAVTYFRMFSRNISARYKENEWYLSKTGRIRKWTQTLKRDMQIRKTHHIYRCPACKQKIRIPKGRGKVEIRCTRCGQTFIRRS